MNAVQQDGWTALMFCRAASHADVVSLLLAARLTSMQK